MRKCHVPPHNTHSKNHLHDIINPYFQTNLKSIFHATL